MLKKNLLWILPICLLFCDLPAKSQEKASRTLLLNGQSFHLEKNFPGVLQNQFFTQEEVVNGTFFRWIQFDALPDKKGKTTLAQMGIELLEYVPQNTYLAAISVDFDAVNLATYAISGISPISHQHKLTNDLLEKNYPEWALKAEGWISLNCSYQRNIDAALVEKTIDDLGYEVRRHNSFARVITLTLPTEEIEQLAKLPIFYHLEAIDPPNEPENYTARTLHRSNTLTAPQAMGRNYAGEGVKVMLQDDGIIGPHIDYQGRIGEQYISSNDGDHGDHVAGIIMGAGNLDPTARGMAYGSDIYVYGAAFQGYPGFDDIPEHYIDPGIRITSTSYSNGCNAGYTSLARTLDQQTRTFPALIHVFSAGNSGTSDCGYGAGNLWGNVTGGHKIGKNVIAVANLDEDDQLLTSSSRGPAHDGRIKPDVSAKGANVYSTVDENSYDFKTGTSMSCPGVSGTLAQLYQAYGELNGGNEPESGLMKAILMNTCDDLGNPGPDFKHGWGRINALSAVKTIENETYFSGELDHNDSLDHSIQVPEDVLELRVMVYWTDHEASAGANTALINDLDITLESPSDQVFMPWVLNTFPQTDSLDLPAIRGEDHLNNVEQVTIENPTAGDYTLWVRGSAVPMGPQVYHVVYEFKTEEVTLTYPIGLESMVPGENEIIRWDAYGNTSSFSLDYSNDDGMTWTAIASGIDSSVRQLNWNVPDEITGLGKIRIFRDDLGDTSVVSFSILEVPEDLEVIWSCPDSIGLTWDSVPGAIAYEVSLLGEKYMDSATTSLSTSAVLRGTNPLSTYWISVKALGPDGAVGRRAIAIQKLPGVDNCDISNDAALLSTNPDNGAYADCHDLSSVTLTIELFNSGNNEITDVPVSYRINGGATIQETFLGTLAPASSASFSFDAPMDLAGQGSYAIEVWTVYPSDENSYNDSLSFSIETIGGDTTEAPWSENFESFLNCATSSNCEQTKCSLTSDWHNEENEVLDEIDWRVNQGETPSSFTGPITDHTLESDEGHYLYLEATDCFDHRASLISPCIDLEDLEAPKLTFWYHMRGAAMGVLHLDIFDGEAWTIDAMSPIIGNQGNNWKEANVDLSDYAGKTINLRVRGITGVDFTSDMALDDFSIVDAVGIKENNALSATLVVQPNPNNGFFRLSANGVIGQQTVLRVIDMYGKEVYHQSLFNENGQIDVEIQLPNLAAGIYQLMLQSDNQFLQLAEKIYVFGK